MSFQDGIKFRSLVELWDWLPENERIMADILRQIIIEHIPLGCKEKLTYNVPYYYGNRRICLIWPAAVPCGGFKEGVLLGFSHGNKLTDPQSYLTHGSNKQVFYKIFQTPDEINESAIISLLKEALEADRRFK